MKTSMKQNETKDGVTKKSGKGLSDGVISELSAFFNVKPGHEEELRAALRRFAENLHNIRPKGDPAGRSTGHAARDLQ